MPAANIQIEKICQNESCRKPFTASSFKAKFCSQTCYKSQWARENRRKIASKPTSQTEKKKQNLTAQAYFSVDDLHKFTGASTKTIYRAIKLFQETEGKEGLKAKKLGKQYIITKENFDKYLNS